MDEQRAAQRRQAAKVGTNACASVVIIDDNEMTRRTLRGFLRHDECLAVVGEAATGEAALPTLDALQPDLVCLDILMPGMDGLSLLRIIREKHPQTRVVMISGAPTPNAVSQARELGAHAFIVKPFSAGKVLRAVRDALGGACRC